MTETEKEAVLSMDVEAAEHLYLEDILEMMRFVIDEKGSDKKLNILFSAITKSFVLGYMRGQQE